MHNPEMWRAHNFAAHAREPKHQRGRTDGRRWLTRRVTTHKHRQTLKHTHTQLHIFMPRKQTSKHRPYTTFIMYASKRRSLDRSYSRRTTDAMLAERTVEIRCDRVAGWRRAIVCLRLRLRELNERLPSDIRFIYMFFWNFYVQT